MAETEVWSRRDGIVTRRFGYTVGDDDLVHLSQYDIARLLIEAGYSYSS